MRLRSIPSLLFATACATLVLDEAEPGPGGGSGPDTTPDTPDEPDEPDEPQDTGGPENVGGGQNAVPGWPFAKEEIHHVSITLSQQSVDNLVQSPWEYTEGAAVVNGTEFEQVGVRLRGKYGSFRELSGKPKLKIDFNRYVDGQKYEGLKSLSLNNTLVDCSYMKEVLASELYEAAGVKASRTAYMTVDINGQDYGLYVLVETQDDRFLKNHWEDGDGNLYDGKYWMDEEWNYVLIDFGIGVDAYFDLEEGVDVGHADIEAISQAYLATEGSDAFYPATQELVDWPSVHRSWAVDQWIGQLDGYCMNRNNYRIYFDPEDGKADWISTDLDYAFFDDRDWGMDWRYPTSTMASACKADAACRADWEAAMVEIIDLADSRDMHGRLDELWALIGDTATTDPKRECNQQYINYYRQSLYIWADERSDQVRREWGM